MKDLIERQDAIDAIDRYYKDKRYITRSRTILSAICRDMISTMDSLPSAQPEEVIPHRNYKYFSDYWCECGWHLGKKGEVKYCSDCGRKVNWGE